MQVQQGKKYQTRSGRPVIIYAVYNDETPKRVHGAIDWGKDDYDENSDGRYTVETWSIEGRYFTHEKERQSTLDLVEVE